MILIDFFEITPVNSLLPIKTMEADKIFFLIDSADRDEPDARHLKEAVEGLDCVNQFTYVPIDSSDINSMRERLKKVVEGADAGEPVYIDLTGGTDLMVAIGYCVSMETEAIPIHIDIVKREAFRIDTGERLGDIKDISLIDYMTAIGAKQLEGSHKNPLDEEEEMICSVAETLFRRQGEWHALCDYIAGIYSKQGDDKRRRFTIPDRIEYTNRKRFNPTALMKEFVKYGFVRYLGSSEREGYGGRGGTDMHYEIADLRYIEYLTVYGIWLEMYVYFKARPYFDEAYLGMIIDWDNDDTVDTVDNEIDVVLMKGSIPYFVSCKMRRVEASDIYEIGFITEHFGGEYGKCFIATTYPLKRDKRGSRNLSIKMEKMKVGMILVTDSKEFDKLIKGRRIGSVLVESEMES